MSFRFELLLNTSGNICTSFCAISCAYCSLIVGENTLHTVDTHISSLMCAFLNVETLHALSCVHHGLGHTNYSLYSSPLSLLTRQEITFLVAGMDLCKSVGIIISGMFYTRHSSWIIAHSGGNRRCLERPAWGHFPSQFF